MEKKSLEACRNCGKERLVGKWQQKQSCYTGLCTDCARRSRHGENHPHWKGGRHLESSGYICVKVLPEDPYYSMAVVGGCYCREHRLVLARHLGRCLSSEEYVHHRNGDKADNRIENLELTSARGHRLSYGAGYQKGYSVGYKAGLKVGGRDKTLL